MEGEVQNTEVQNQETPAAEVQETQSTPEMIGELEVGAVNTAMTAHYGDGATLERFEELRGVEGKYNDLQTEYEAHKVRSKNDRFASPMVQKIDELIRGGGETVEAIKLMTLQNLNLTDMGSDDLIKEQLALKHPSLSREEINDHFGSLYPALDEDAEDVETRTRNVELKIAGEEAKKFLEEQMVATESPKAVEQRKADETAREKRVNDIGIVTNSLMKQTRHLTIDVDDKNFKFDFKFNIPENSEKDQSIRNDIVNYYAARNETVSEEVLQLAVTETYKQHYFKEFMTAALIDLEAQITKRGVMGESNPLPVEKGSGQSTIPPPSKRTAAVKKGGQTFV